MLKIISFLFLLICLMTSRVSWGQTTNFKHDLLLENINDESQLAISLTKTTDVLNYIQERGLQVKHITSNWVFLTINGKQLRKLLDSPVSKALYTEISQPTMTNDTSRLHHQVNEVQNGLNGLQSKFTGSGILLGYVDTGLDFNHPDFKDSLGKTRVFSYWDQTITTSTSTSPQPYNYGANWTSTEIDNGQCTAVDNLGHGTHVVGISAGNGRANGKNKGMAPEATIVMVKTNNSAKNWTLTVSDACDYIFKIADQLGKPCVINISYGVAMGSHDGNDPASELIESLIDAKPGRIVVAAAGNNGNLGKYHIHGDVTSDTSFFWVKSTAKGIAGTNSILLEMWADSLKFKDVKFATGVNLPSSNYALRGKTKFRTFAEALTFSSTSLRDTLFNENGLKLAYIDYYAEMVNHECHLQVAYTKIDSTNYLFQFMSTGSGSYDVWGGSVNKVGSKNFNDFETSNIPSPSVYPSIVNYIMADTLQTIFSSYISSEKVITVGNVSNKASYTTKDQVFHTSVYQPGEIHVSSSKGPNRKGITKPDIVASGTKIFSANPLSFLNDPTNYPAMDVEGFHMLNSGTSMASPLVAGIAALYLEKCSNATYLDFKNDVISTAKTSSIQGVVPNNAYGNGEINALSLLLKTNAKTSISGNTKITCLNPVTISISSDRGISSILWGDLDAKATKTFASSGKYAYKIMDAKNCIYKDTIVITQTPILTSSITVLGNKTISCTNKTVTVKVNGGASYQWSGGDRQQNDTNTFNRAGTYFVVVTDSNLCSKKDSIIITGDTIAPTINFKFIKDSIITCATKSILVKVSGGTLIQWNGGVNPKKDTNQFKLPGYFSVEMSNSNGCIKKDSVLIQIDTIQPKILSNYLGGKTLTCTNKTVSIVLSGGETYKWFAGNQPLNDTNTFSEPGIYSVEVTGKNKCLNTKNITILQDTISPTLSIFSPTGNSVNCTKLKVTLFASGASSYQWTGGLLKNLDSNIYQTGGKYSLIGTNFNGCTSTKSFQIISDTIKPKTTLNFQGDSILTCINKSVRVSMFGAQTYFWSGGNVYSNTVQDFTKEGTYQLRSIGNNTCERFSIITIKKDTSLPIITKSLSTPSYFTCKNKTVQITILGASTLQWDGGNSPLNSLNTFSQPGVYHFIANNKNGCLINDSVTINSDTIPVNSSIQINGINKLSCSNHRVYVKIVGGVSYSWDGGNSLQSDTNSFNTPGKYSVNVIDSKGCNSKQFITIQQDIAAPIISINLLTSPYITCDNNPVKVKVIGAKSYVWNGGKYKNLDTNTFTLPGTYYVNATGSNGCTSSDTIIVEQHFYPTTPVITQKDSLLIASSSPNYQWYVDGELIVKDTNQSIVYTIDKTYFVSVISNGCISTSKFYTPTISGISREELTSIEAYPNPTNTGRFVVSGIETNDKLKAYDLLGNIIGIQTVGLNEYQLESVADGVYFISIERNSRTMLVKIIKN